MVCVVYSVWCVYRVHISLATAAGGCPVGPISAPFPVPRSRASNIYQLYALRYTALTDTHQPPPPTQAQMSLPSPNMSDNNTTSTTTTATAKTTTTTNNTPAPSTTSTKKRKVGRPGRKRIDIEAKNKRTQQNRTAQRAYRERKEAKLQNLENKILWLERLNKQNLNDLIFLQDNLNQLLSQVNDSSRDKLIQSHLVQSNEIKDNINSQLSKINDTLVAGSSNSNNNNNNNNKQSKKISTTTSPAPALPLPPPIQDPFELNNTWDTTTTHNNQPSTILNDNINNISIPWDSFKSTSTVTSSTSASSPQNNNNNNNNIFDFNNTFDDNIIIHPNNILLSLSNNNTEQHPDPLAFPDIWSYQNNNNNNNTTTIIPSIDDIPFDCNCNGTCNNNNNTSCDSDNEDNIKCDLLTRHLLNNESIQSVLNDTKFLDSGGGGPQDTKTCSHYINNLKLLQNNNNNNIHSSFDSIVENLCNELMIKCTHDPNDQVILLNKKDLNKAILNV